MLIDLFKRLRFAPIEEYQYVGFGSVAFVDFRMVHRSLGILDLTSIEDTDDPDEQVRFERNRPYANVNLHFGNSAKVLPRLNFARRSLVWLDYDQMARRSMANDITSVARNASSGTFIGFTFTDSFPAEIKQATTALHWLRQGFPEFVQPDAKITDFQGAKYAKFIRTTFTSLLQTALANADAGKPSPEDKRRAIQVCFIKYRDGVPMATIGWILVAAGDLPVLEKCALDGLPFYSAADEPFVIAMPKVTPLEIREMEMHLPSPETSDELSWLPVSERKIFADNYRYLPNFAPVEAL